MQALSLSKGFPATTVDEVCAMADVSKGSFYHHFETKEDLGHAALDQFFDGLVTAFTEGPFNDESDAVQRMHSFVRHASVVCAGPLMRSGCMLGSFALDLAESDREMRHKLEQQFQAIASFVGSLIGDAAEAAGLEVLSERLAQQFLAIVEGSIVLAKAYDDPNVLSSGVDLFGHHLELIFTTDP